MNLDVCFRMSLVDMKTDDCTKLFFFTFSDIVMLNSIVTFCLVCLKTLQGHMFHGISQVLLSTHEIVYRII